MSSTCPADTAVIPGGRQAAFPRNTLSKVLASLSNNNETLSQNLNSLRSRKDMRLDVQGLRAVAVLAVLAYHMNSTWLPAGFVGVDVFFVISGFIITPLLTEPGQKIHLAAFYLNRIKRIVPAYAVMLALVSVVSSMLFLTADFEFFHQSLKSAAIFASNLYFADFGSYFAPRAEELPLLHTWSLAIEMQFYLSARYNPLMVGPVPVEQARYAAPELICHGQQVGECKRGLAGAVPSILVIGDSHAAQLNYFFDQAGTEQGVAYRVLTASSCVPIPGFDVERLPDYAQQACRSQIIAVKQALVTMDKVIIAGMWQYQMPSPAFVKALQAFLDDATTAHKQVVILGQVPMFRSDVQRVRRFRELGLPATLAFNDEWRVANQQVEMLATGRAGVHFVDFSNSGFFADAPYEHGELIYQDTHHLNEIGARRYGHFAGGQLQRLFDQTQSSVSLKQ